MASKRPVQKAEMLNEVVIAEIWEIFTLFDKNADGYVATSELGTMIRGLGFNPTEREVADMQKDVDPNQTGSFDKNSLISLIARRPKKEDTLQNMIEALTIIGSENANDNTTPNPKMQFENFKQSMVTNGKENGENLLDHFVTEIVADSKLLYEDSIMIEDFAQYLMSK